MTMTMETHNVDIQESLNGISYSIVKTEEDQERMAQFYLNQFTNLEPFSKAMGGFDASKEDPKKMKAMVLEQKEYYSNGTTLQAVDEETGQLVGMMSAVSVHKDFCPPHWVESLEETVEKYPLVEALGYFTMECFDVEGTLRRYPHVKQVFYLFALGTRPDFARRGIATQLTKLSFQVGKKTGAEVAMMMTSSNFSRKIAYKMGMETTMEMRWDEVKMPGYEDKEKLLKNIEGGDKLEFHCCKL